MNFIYVYIYIINLVYRGIGFLYYFDVNNY